MSSPKFLVFKLKDLRIPALVLLIVVALFVLLIFKNKTAQTFSSSNGYEDGKYIAGITLSDADMDLVVEVKDNNIVNIALSGLDESSSLLYKDLVTGVEYVNTYVTATQSLELPQNGNINTATMLLMDAVKVALSDDAHASLTTTYEKVNLTPSDNLLSPTEEISEEFTQESLVENEIFVDEFQEEDFPEVDNASEDADLSIEQ